MEKYEIFIDPSVVGPRELNADEMSDLSGAGLPVVWATFCGEGLASAATVAAITLIDPGG